MKYGRAGRLYLLVGLSEILTVWILCLPLEQTSEGLFGLFYVLVVVVLGVLSACIVSLAALVAYTYIFLGIQMLLPGLAATVLSVAITVFAEYVFDVKHALVRGLVHAYPEALKDVYLPVAEFMFPFTSFVALVAGVGITAVGLYVRLRIAYGFWTKGRSYWRNPFLRSMTRRIDPIPGTLDVVRGWWSSTVGTEMDQRAAIPSPGKDVDPADAAVPARQVDSTEMAPKPDDGPRARASVPHHGSGGRRRRAYKAARKIHRRKNS